MSAVIALLQWVLYSLLAIFTAYSVYFIEYKRGRIPNRADDMDIPEASRIATDEMFPRKTYSISAVCDSTTNDLFTKMNDYNVAGNVDSA